MALGPQRRHGASRLSVLEREERRSTYGLSVLMALAFETSARSCRPPPTAAYLALSCSPSAYVGGRVQTSFGQLAVSFGFASTSEAPTIVKPAFLASAIA